MSNMRGAHTHNMNKKNKKAFGKRVFSIHIYEESDEPELAKVWSQDKDGWHEYPVSRRDLAYELALIELKKWYSVP